MIDFIRADHINICVPPERLEEARLFYADVIGLPHIERPHDVFPHPGHWFMIGNIELHIGIERALPRSIRHTAFEVANVITAKKYLKRHNVEVHEEEPIPGRTRFSFIDPFGNRMEFLQMIE